jgi:di/tricarboxylate transporter
MTARQADINDIDRVDRTVRVREYDTHTETKASFLTTELWAMVGVIAAILIAAQRLDQFSAEEAWTLVAAVAIGYMVSRGLAKSGSHYHED